MFNSEKHKANSERIYMIEVSTYLNIWFCHFASSIVRKQNMFDPPKMILKNDQIIVLWKFEFCCLSFVSGIGAMWIKWCFVISDGTYKHSV